MRQKGFFDVNNKDYAAFEGNFVNILNKHAPKKTNIFNGYHIPHVSKAWRFDIMKSSHLKNKANKFQLLSKVIKNNKIEPLN